MQVTFAWAVAAGITAGAASVAAASMAPASFFIVGGPFRVPVTGMLVPACCNYLPQRPLNLLSIRQRCVLEANGFLVTGWSMTSVARVLRTPPREEGVSFRWPRWPQ